VTAVTDSPAAAGTGWPPSDSGRQAGHGGTPEGRSATADRPVSTAPAATPATAAKSGRALVPAARSRHLSAVPADASAPTSRDTGSHLSPQVAPAAPRDRRDGSGQDAPVAATAGSPGAKPAGRPPVSGPAGGARGPLPGHPAPASASGPPVAANGGGARPELSAEAYVEGLDGSERAVLLRHLAQAWPEVVEAGVELVAQWRAECAERRQEAAKRKRREQRRRARQRAAELGGG